MSRYVRPAWHKDGNYVACGFDSNVSVKEQSPIHLWDLRMLKKKHSELPTQTFSLGTSRIVHSTFSSVDNSLFALSLDRSLTILDYSLI